jgi:hypothetical protein
MDEDSIKFFSLVGCLLDNVNALDLAHGQFIENAADAALINVRKHTGDAEARNIGRHSSKINCSHFECRL